jgi:hypothetical protein
MMHGQKNIKFTGIGIYSTPLNYNFRRNLGKKLKTLNDEFSIESRKHKTFN